MFERFKDKKVVVVGLARSGVGAANLLVRLGSRVTVMDVKTYGELSQYIGKLDSSVDIKLGNFNGETLGNSDLIVVSPGVPLTIAELAQAKQMGKIIMGELELAYQVMEEFRKSTPLGFLAITGTNGKSTTTTLLYEILRHSGLNTIIGGNIGLAITEEISKLVKNFDKPREFVSPDYIVTEVSSFQLESIDKFKPKVSVILNITPDHLDRHVNMSEYIEAKCRIFMNQDEMNFIILNADEPSTSEIASRIKKKGPDILYFSRKKEVRGAFYRDGAIYFNIPELEVLCPELVSQHSTVLNTSEFRIKGVHNIENAMAASLVALVCGSNVSDIRDTLASFNGLEHRLEFVEEVDGVKYYNDSKGTNVWAVIKSLEGFDEPIVLIAGGRDKVGDFSDLRPLVKDKVKAAIVIGESRYKLRETLKDVTAVYEEDSLNEAVRKARLIARPGEVVLFSPACASFDMFRDFEQRGIAFKECVSTLAYGGVGAV
ncbi:MAG: UDP-N-acetylmuramoyl-L-alanine--D-glutamate ligase [Nitrospirae bacterium]|nr:UDP-N-acetylmuramoyl-L-alanine--D-glutamate ligase [Nitrospirota bacterium]